MRLDETDNDVGALTLEQVGFFEHSIGFADAGSRADVQAQPGGRCLLLPGEQRHRLLSEINRLTVHRLGRKRGESTHFQICIIFYKTPTGRAALRPGKSKMNVSKNAVNSEH